MLLFLDRTPQNPTWPREPLSIKIHRLGQHLHRLLFTETLSCPNRASTRTSSSSLLNIRYRQSSESAFAVTLSALTLVELIFTTNTINTINTILKTLLCQQIDAPSLPQETRQNTHRPRTLKQNEVVLGHISSLDHCRTNLYVHRFVVGQELYSKLYRPV
jgi:hypothetical protein